MGEKRRHFRAALPSSWIMTFIVGALGKNAFFLPTTTSEPLTN
jgi:hypothetical protein